MRSGEPVMVSDASTEHLLTARAELLTEVEHGDIHMGALIAMAYAIDKIEQELRARMVPLPPDDIPS